MDQETDFLGGVFKIALGIALGGALLWFGVSQYEAYQLQNSILQASAQLQAESEVARNAQLRREADAWVERELSQVKDLQQRQVELQARYQVEQRVAAKERAWLRHYVRPSRCERPDSFDVNVECGNVYMKAKREFEAKWAAENP